MYVYVLYVCDVIHTDTYQYIHIHAHTYIYMHIHTIHTHGYTHDTYNTYRYQRIHTHTYTYIHQAISVERGFCAAVAAARDASAQRHLPRSSPTGLGACSPSAKCVWNAYWLSRGCTLDPPTRAARARCAGAPKWVRGWVSDGRKKWSATCPGVP